MTMRKIGCIRLHSMVFDDLGQLLPVAGNQGKVIFICKENFSCMLVLFSEAFLYSVEVVQSEHLSRGWKCTFLLNTSDFFIQTERARGYIFLMCYNCCCRSSFGVWAFLDSGNSLLRHLRAARLKSTCQTKNLAN